MTKAEYLNTIAVLYRVANNSDTDIAEWWIPKNACGEYCHWLEALLHQVCDDTEYENFFNDIL